MNNSIKICINDNLLNNDNFIYIHSNINIDIKAKSNLDKNITDSNSLWKKLWNQYWKLVLTSPKPNYIWKINKRSFKINLQIFLISDKQNILFKLGAYLDF